MTRAAGPAYAAASTIATPVIWDAGGYAVPIVPAIVGIVAVLLVRIIVVTKSRPGFRTYNVAVTLLCAMAALVTVVDHQLGVGAAFWTGVGAGALGVGIVEIGKSQAALIFNARARAALSAFFGKGDA